MCVPLSVMQYCHHSALVRGVGDVCSSVSHAILPSLCLSMSVGDVCSSVSHAILPSLCLSHEVWVMWVPLSVMQYCHHSALV